MQTTTDITTSRPPLPSPDEVAAELIRHREQSGSRVEAVVRVWLDHEVTDVEQFLLVARETLELTRGDARMIARRLPAPWQLPDTRG